MNRVVAAKPEFFGALAGMPGEILVDTDGYEARLQLREGNQRSFMLVLSQPAVATCGREGGPTLRVGEDARGCRVGAAPELGSELGPVLDDDELDQRRGVEVEDQARCSATRSDT